MACKIGELRLRRVSAARGSLGVLLPQQVDRALAAPLDLGQSVLLVWPQVVALIGAVLVFFAVGYVLFMREEVRA